MNTFDRHLLREWIQILFLVLATLCGLLFVQICYDDFRQLLEVGAPASDFWRYVLVTMPSFLGVVLPLALLISLLYTLTKFHRSNELTAMRVAGVGFLRLTAPVWAVGLVACGIVWWLNSTIVPWSVEQSRLLEESMQHRRQEKVLPPDRVGAVYSVAFDNPDARRTWFFNRYRKAPPARGYGVSVSEMDPLRRETTRIVAAQAWHDEARGGWVFRDGRELRFEPENGILMASAPFIERYEPGFREDPRLMLLTDQRPRDLSFFELRRLITYYAVENNPKGVPYAVRYFSILADTLAPLVVIAIAIPFAVTGVRVNPAVGVSKSIGLFFLYYVLSTIAASLATKQLIEPAVAAWLPNIGMAGLAAWLFARLR